MAKTNSVDPTADPISIARCRELLSDEAVGLSDEEVDRIWRRADAIAHVLIEIFVQNRSTCTSQ
jgi:hypothetical protein